MRQLTRNRARRYFRDQNVGGRHCPLCGTYDPFLLETSDEDEVCIEKKFECLYCGRIWIEGYFVGILFMDDIELTDDPFFASDFEKGGQYATN